MMDANENSRDEENFERTMGEGILYRPVGLFGPAQT